jgi:phosphoglycolate phosphatase-like HAD superfamily hydrolase
MFQNIIFDWSGVINDNSFAVYQTVLEILSTKGINLSLNFDEFRKLWKQPYMDFYHQFLPEFTQEEQSSLYQQILPKYEKDQVYLGIDLLINKLYDLNINCFIVSSDHSENLFRQLKAFNLKESYFKKIIYGVHHKSSSVQELINEYQLNLNKTIFIGDSNHEIDSSKENGIKSCGVTWGLSDESNLLTAKPDFIAHDISELEEIILK